MTSNTKTKVDSRQHTTYYKTVHKSHVRQTSVCDVTRIHVNTSPSVNLLTCKSVTQYRMLVNTSRLLSYSSTRYHPSTSYGCHTSSWHLGCHVPKSFTPSSGCWSLRREPDTMDLWLIPRSGASSNYGKTLFRLIEIVRMFLDTSLKRNCCLL